MIGSGQESNSRRSASATEYTLPAKQNYAKDEHKSINMYYVGFHGLLIH